MTRPGIDERLAQALAHGAFADILRLAIERSSLPLDRIEARLRNGGHRISATTLSNWQRGDTVPVRASSLAALGDLERMLGLPLRSLAQGARRARVPRRTTTEQLVPSAEAVDRLRRRVGPERFGGYVTQHVHETHHLDTAGIPHRHETRQVITATRSGLDAYYYLFLTRDGGPGGPDPVAVEGLAGCTPGAVLFEPPDVVCVPLHFGSRLAEGETHLFEYATHLSYDEAPPPEFRRGVRQPLEDLLLRVVFHPERRPVRVRAVRWTDPAETPETLSELRLDSGGAVHHLLQRPAPGTYGIVWEWPGDPRDPAR